MNSRQHFCSKCPVSSNNVCFDCKAIHPDKDCFIDVGLSMDKAHCPRGLWGKNLSVVWPYLNHADSCLALLTFSIRSVKKNFSHKSIHVVGDPSPYTTLLSPRKERSKLGKWKDAIVKLRKIIDDPTITDDFIYMYDDTFILKPTTLKDYYLPTFTEGSGLLWEWVRDNTIRQLPPNALNYSTHYPIQFNKQKLQQVLDTFEFPYLVELAYLNLHGTPTPMDATFLFTRSTYFYVPDNVEVLNVKRWSTCLERLLENEYSNSI